jgi:hypothetical protein
MLSDWTGIIGPALQHIATTLYIRRQKKQDTNLLLKLRNEHIRNDEEAGLVYSSKAKFGKKYGWRFTDSNWHSFEMQEEVMWECAEHQIVPGFLYERRYPNLCSDEWSGFGLARNRENDREWTLPMCNLGGKPILISTVDLIQGDYLEVISSNAQFGDQI